MRILFRDNEGTLQELTATINDVFAMAGAEYIALSTGETLRLDQLCEVDSVKLEER